MTMVKFAPFYACLKGKIVERRADFKAHIDQSCFWHLWFEHSL